MIAEKEIESFNKAQTAAKGVMAAWLEEKTKDGVPNNDVIRVVGCIMTMATNTKAANLGCYLNSPEALATISALASFGLTTILNDNRKVLELQASVSEKMEADIERAKATLSAKSAEPETTDTKESSNDG